MENKNSNKTHDLEKTQASDMQLRRLTLFSSGVGFFEHYGSIEGSAEFLLPFNKDAVNDALKSIVINDPDASPSVSYHSENTLQRTMQGLSIDLTKNNHIAELLSSLKGAEIEVHSPSPIKGRILLVEYRRRRANRDEYMVEREAFLSLLTPHGVKIISFSEISGFSFADPKIQADANRALDLILQSRDSNIRNLAIKLPGKKSRKVSISYVIPTPVWKVSYRLDLAKEKPFLQGWATVDNDSDTDWEQVELALVTGKPVSFIQNLYAPYHLERPTLPLAIAGIAKAKTFDSGKKRSIVSLADEKPRRRYQSRGISSGVNMAQPQIDALYCMREADYDEPELSVEELLVSTQLEEGNFSMSEGLVETAYGRQAGDQFEFTVKTPVSLARQQSAMLPLIEGAVHAEKMLVFSGDKAYGKPMNPAIAAELINNTGMKLPAGPITVYDGGTYAGDALIAFFPEEEKRFISYGEDLSVSGSYTEKQSRMFSAVSIKEGIMSIKSQNTHERTYTFRNASTETKRLIVEHPIRRSGTAKLVSPAEYMEKTHDLYRFEMQLLPGEMIFVVKEEEPAIRQITLSQSYHELVSHSVNQELPAVVRANLQRAIELKKLISVEEERAEKYQTQLGRLFAEQERTRKNLEAAGSGTQQGQSYLVRLMEQDKKIDALHKSISQAEQAMKDAQQVYNDYIHDMFFK